MKHEGSKVNEALGFAQAEQFARDIGRALEAGGDFVIAVMDLDHFDAVNTRFGHEEGDRVLIALGTHLKQKLPREAALYRCGGDEFGVIFPEHMEREEVFLALEQIRKNHGVIVCGGTAVSFTAGIACVPDDAALAGELIRKAEGAMYRCKLAGGNRVCFPREDKMVTKTTHYTAEQLKRLTKLSGKEGVGEAALLREALDALLKKYDV